MCMSKTNPSTSHQDIATQATEGKDMPAKTPRTQRPRTGQPSTAKDGSVEASLELPHQRDRAVGMTASTPIPLVEQAAHDVGRGLKDTSKDPEMDRAYKKLVR